MTRKYSYSIRKVDTSKEIFVFGSSRGLQRNDPSTPTQARKRIIEDRIYELDRLMETYVDNYLRRRLALAMRFMNQETVEIKDMTPTEREMMAESHRKFREEHGLLEED